jgi:DNA-binding IclR family transcriptional regulator
MAQQATASQAVQGTKSVSRAISLLRAVARYDENGAHLSTLARNVGLHVVTARRLLSVLVAEGLVSFDPQKKLYKIGIALYHMGSAAKQFDIREKLRSTLEKIADETEDTVFLFVRRGNDAVCIDRIEGRFPIRALLVDVGMSRPLGIGASGLALIAFLPHDQFEEAFSASVKHYKSSYNFDPQKILALARKSQKKGYVVSESFFWQGVTAVSVPVFDAQGGVIAAISVSAISSRMNANRQKEVSEILRKYQKIS